MGALQTTEPSPQPAEHERQTKVCGLAAHPSVSSPWDWLQRTVGNLAVGRLYSMAEASVAGSRLRVGAADDVAEREADRVAHRITDRLHSPEGAHEEPPARFTKPVGRGEAVTPDTEQAIAQERGGGQPIPAALSSGLERSLGADLSAVRVHHDGQSDRLARSVGARAFTVGSDLFFKQGEYAPRDRAGQEMIAHEVTHVIQQRSGASSPVGAGVLQRVTDASHWCEEKKVNTKTDTAVNRATLRTQLRTYATTVLLPEYTRVKDTGNGADKAAIFGAKEYMISVVPSPGASVDDLTTYIAALDALAAVVTSAAASQDADAAAKKAEQQKAWAEKDASQKKGLPTKDDAPAKVAAWAVIGADTDPAVQVKAAEKSAYQAFITDLAKGTDPKDAGAGTTNGRDFEMLKNSGTGTGGKTNPTYSIRLSQGNRLYFKMDAGERTVTIVRWGDHSMS